MFLASIEHSQSKNRINLAEIGKARTLQKTWTCFRSECVRFKFITMGSGGAANGIDDDESSEELDEWDNDGGTVEGEDISAEEDLSEMGCEILH